ncbi:adenosine deaminase [Isoptericola sp. b441]|uniref:adenosine deaminase n=1 Tax=Actinotalea lenta TaxID=3064654 RepID=A0ABT9D9W1_9CELL|nr:MULTISPECIES: adenosine deaminase [unclassified Isoptericola]MDO8106913.1 adenosine deaminase [Isoptericola sp. b441]MDO8121376.1 adenosine deaminase [Isoptericola sp. b490]
MTDAALTRDDVAALPKVLLHDHLDGGVRPQTVLELAGEVGHPVPADEPTALARWFLTAASSGSLEDYLTTFEHTLAVMQRADHLRRIAAEAVVDLAQDGVVHAELRYAPELHQREGLTGDDVVGAVADGIADGIARAAEAGRRIRVVQILTIMRQADHGRATAELALRWRHAGVGGVDLAGPEDGYGPARHQYALRRLRQASMPVTIHAGEGAGVVSIAEALHLGGAVRIGHGARLIEDITLGRATEDDPWGLDGASLGELAHWVRDQQVPLEVCPTSNLHTHLAPSLAAHPVTALQRLGFAVTISTDNRLMSQTSPTTELWRLVEIGWTLEDLRDVTLTAAWSTFVHADEREALVEDVLLPAFTPKGRHRA